MLAPSEPAFLSTTMSSPLAPLLGGLGEALPNAFRQQFLTSPDANMTVLVDGIMDSVWYPRWLMPVFWVLGRVGILVPTAGRAVPTTLEVIPEWDAAHQPQQQWNRTFTFGPEQHHHFDTLVIYDPQLGQAMDRVGPGKQIYLLWQITFIAPRTLKIERERSGIGVGRRVLWLPRWLGPLLLGRERFTQQVDPLHDDKIHIELIINHPLLGDIFAYRGTFNVSLQPK